MSDRTECGPAVGLSAAGSKDPWTLLGLPKDANLNTGDWETPNQKEHGRWSTFSVEQKLTTGLYLSAAGNVARFAKDFDVDSFYPVSVDVNRYLPDGTVNPGFLVPYSQTTAQQRCQLTQLEQYRAELSYQQRKRPGRAPREDGRMAERRQEVRRPFHLDQFRNRA